MTAGDVAARAGVSVDTSAQALNAIASDASGSLEVSPTGELVYALPENFRSELTRRSLKLRLEPAVEKAKVAANALSSLPLPPSFVLGQCSACGDPEKGEQHSLTPARNSREGGGADKRDEAAVGSRRPQGRMQPWKRLPSLSVSGPPSPPPYARPLPFQCHRAPDPTSCASPLGLPSSSRSLPSGSGSTQSSTPAPAAQGTVPQGLYILYPSPLSPLQTPFRPPCPPSLPPSLPREPSNAAALNPRPASSSIIWSLQRRPPRQRGRGHVPHAGVHELLRHLVVLRPLLLPAHPRQVRCLLLLLFLLQTPAPPCSYSYPLSSPCTLLILPQSPGTRIPLLFLPPCSAPS